MTASSFLWGGTAEEVVVLQDSFDAFKPLAKRPASCGVEAPHVPSPLLNPISVAIQLPISLLRKCFGSAATVPP